MTTTKTLILLLPWDNQAGLNKELLLVLSVEKERYYLAVNVLDIAKHVSYFELEKMVASRQDSIIDFILKSHSENL